MIAGVRTTPLTPRVVALSWAVALVVWPLVWWLLAAATGAGVSLFGGDWIGLAVPLGGQPWALVNEPGIAFAVSRAALLGYWLPSLALAAVLALALPSLAPGGKGWVGELVVLHAATACAVLGLAWAPPLGVHDGPAAGLNRFWHVPPGVTIAASLVVAVVAVQPVVIRLCAALWRAPGGPLRRRRLAAVALHLVLPALTWATMATIAGWFAPLAAYLTVFTVLAAAIVGAFSWLPKHPIAGRPDGGIACGNPV